MSLHRLAWALIVASAPFAYTIGFSPDPEDRRDLLSTVRQPVPSSRLPDGGGPPLRSARAGVPPHGYLGVLTGPTDLEITGIAPGSPAEAAGLRAGDVLETIDGMAVRDARHLVRSIAARRPGTRVVVRVSRDGGLLDVPVVLAERPMEGRRPRRGGR